MLEFIKFILSDLFVFIGFCIIAGGLLNFTYDFYTRTLRHFAIMKHGYPPEHCDSDGDLLTNKEEDGDN